MKFSVRIVLYRYNRMVKSFGLKMKLSCLGKEMFIKKLYQLYFSSEVQQYLPVLSCLKVSPLMFAVSKVKKTLWSFHYSVGHSL